MKTLIDAARNLVAKYEAMPDGDLGRGLTNGDFFALRDAVQVFEQGKNVDTPTSHLRNALQVFTLAARETESGDCAASLTPSQSLAVERRILAALEQLEPYDRV